MEDGWRPPARVLWVNASGAVSGAEAVLLDHVDAALAGGAEVTVASPPGPLVARLPDGVRHVPLPAFGLGVASGRVARGFAALRLAWRTLATARRLRSEVRRPGTRTAVNSLLALPAVRLARPAERAAWLVHDVAGMAAQRRFVAFGFGGRRPALALAVAVSEATAAPLRALGVPVVVRVNGVRWPVDTVPLALSDPPVVGSAALLVPWKGHAVLLDAIARLPQVRCELAGGHLPEDADHVARLQTRAEQPDLAGRVRFLGHVDGVAALRGWDVAVLASTSPEAGPLAVLEAMSLGVPVVATDHGGSAELLGGGRGLLAPPGDATALADAIAAALDPAARPALSEAARAHVAAHHDRRATLPAQVRAVLDPVPA